MATYHVNAAAAFRAVAKFTVAYLEIVKTREFQQVVVATVTWLRNGSSGVQRGVFWPLPT